VPERTIQLPELHPGQRRIVDQARRYNVCCFGRRWGKNVLGMDRLIHTALSGKPAAWFAPQYKLLAPVWRELQLRLKPVIRASSEQEKRLELQGGGSVEMWSLDSADAGRGRAYALVAIDEVALIPDLERAWQETIRPMLNDYQGGAWFLSTPRGTNNFFHQLYSFDADPLKPQWRSWQMPTNANPFIAPEEIEDARRDLPELAFAQEYLAQFVTWTGQVFRNIQAAVCEPPLGPAAIISVDWAGRGVGDFTVFVVLHESGAVLEIDRFRGIDYPLQLARRRNFWEKHERPWIIAEDNAMGAPLVSQPQRDGLPVVPFVTTAASKLHVIETLALGFEQGKIGIPNDPVLIGELQAFESRTMNGYLRYGAPAGLHDDCVWRWRSVTAPWMPGVNTVRRLASCISISRTAAFRNIRGETRISSHLTALSPNHIISSCPSIRLSRLSTKMIRHSIAAGW
jgi:hypothetical protein